MYVIFWEMIIGNRFESSSQKQFSIVWHDLPERGVEHKTDTLLNKLPMAEARGKLSTPSISTSTVCSSGIVHAEK